MNEKLCKNFANSRVNSCNKITIFCDQGYVIYVYKLRLYNNSSMRGPTVTILSLDLTVLGVFTCTSKHAQNCQFCAERLIKTNF